MPSAGGRGGPHASCSRTCRQPRPTSPDLRHRSVRVTPTRASHSVRRLGSSRRGSVGAVPFGAFWLAFLFVAVLVVSRCCLCFPLARRSFHAVIS
eukprot:6191515-Pleurochrysis_carterae.AAC.1